MLAKWRQCRNGNFSHGKFKDRSDKTSRNIYNMQTYYLSLNTLISHFFKFHTRTNFTQANSVPKKFQTIHTTHASFNPHFIQHNTTHIRYDIGDYRTIGDIRKAPWTRLKLRHIVHGLPARIGLGHGPRPRPKHLTMALFSGRLPRSKKSRSRSRRPVACCRRSPLSDTSWPRWHCTDADGHTVPSPNHRFIASFFCFRTCFFIEFVYLRCGETLLLLYTSN